MEEETELEAANSIQTLKMETVPEQKRTEGFV